MNILNKKYQHRKNEITNEVYEIINFLNNKIF